MDGKKELRTRGDRGEGWRIEEKKDGWMDGRKERKKERRKAGTKWEGWREGEKERNERKEVFFFLVQSKRRRAEATCAAIGRCGP
ncbi:npr3, partial [Ophiophagus hannah]